jgi:hypothetical protein
MWKLYAGDEKDIFYSSSEYIVRIFDPILYKQDNLYLIQIPLSLGLFLLEKSKLDLDFYKELFLYSYSKSFFNLKPNQSYIFLFHNKDDVYKINGEFKPDFDENDIIFSFDEMEEYFNKIMEEREDIGIFLPQIVTFSINKNFNYVINSEKEIPNLLQKPNVFIIDCKNKKIEKIKVKPNKKIIYFMDTGILKISDDLMNILSLKVYKKKEKNKQSRENAFIIIDLEENPHTIEKDNDILFVMYSIILDKNMWQDILHLVCKEKVVLNFLFKYKKYYIIKR